MRPDPFAPTVPISPSSPEPVRPSRRKVAETIVAMHGRGQKTIAHRIPDDVDDPARLVRGAQLIVAQDRQRVARKAARSRQRKARRKNRT